MFACEGPSIIVFPSPLSLPTSTIRQKISNNCFSICSQYKLNDTSLIESRWGEINKEQIYFYGRLISQDTVLEKLEIVRVLRAAGKIDVTTRPRQVRQRENTVLSFLRQTLGSRRRPGVRDLALHMAVCFLLFHSRVLAVVCCCCVAFIEFDRLMVLDKRLVESNYQRAQAVTYKFRGFHFLFSLTVRLIYQQNPR